MKDILFKHKDGIVFTSEAMKVSVRQGIYQWSEFEPVSVSWAAHHVRSVHHIRTVEDFIPIKAQGGLK